jgi:hypothetical protein
MSDGKFDPHRRLCPDGACIGVIGDDGRCHVCGRAAGGGKDAAPPAGFVPAGENEAVDEDEDEDEGAQDAAGGEPKQAGAFDPGRRLCPDGGCIGVLGADGVCTVCGQKAD